MHIKGIQSIWVKLTIMTIWILTSFSTFAHATWEVSLANLKESVMLTSDDNSLINAAVTRVEKLQKDIETIKEELLKLDEEEKARNPEMTENYKQARAEIVRVISSIKSENAKLETSLNKLTQYQKKMKEFLKQLRDARFSSDRGRKYLSEYMTLLYKMQLKIYDQEWENIDDIRLFINSDNFNETFIWNDLIWAMTVELWELIKATTQEEEKKTNLLIKLWSLKTAAQENIELYRKEIEKLEQKKLYLISFINLYREKADTKFESILSNKE